MPCAAKNVIMDMKIYWSILLVAAGFACLAIIHCYQYRKQVKQIENQLKQFKDASK